MILPERGNCWERTDSLGQNGGMAFGKPTTVTVSTDTKPIKLQGKRFDVRELESVVFLLREEPTLRGVYRLTFATGERYVGQSVNVANRFVSHRHRWSDITGFEFFPLENEDLDFFERALITLTEQSDELRNKALTHKPMGSRPLEVELETGTTTLLPWERDRRIKPDQNLASTEAERFAKLLRHRDYPLIREIFGWYIYNTISDPINTQKHLWTVTCLPSTNKSKDYRRLAVVNVGNLETAVAYEVTDETGQKQSQIFFNTAIDEEITEGVYEGGALMIAPGNYRVADCMAWITTVEYVYQQLFSDEDMYQEKRFLDDAYVLNTRLMRSGGTMYGRFHNQILARDVIAASLLWQETDWSATVSPHQ